MADAVVRQLCHNYGSAYPRVLELVETDPALGRTVGESNVLLAEVVHAVRDEMALKLSDVVLRRTDLGAGADPGDEALAVCAERMGSELGWTPEDRQREIDEVKVGYPNWPRGGVGP
jgi:glycerol-3-phosphate dehydrogenase